MNLRRIVQDRLNSDRLVAYFDTHIQVYFKRDFQRLADLFGSVGGDVSGLFSYISSFFSESFQTETQGNRPPPEDLLQWLNPQGHIRRACCVAIGGVAITALIMGSAHALPTGYQSTSGNVQFSQSGDTLNVTTTAQRSIATYQSFNIAQHETVNFNLPSRSSAILNRVTGGAPSQILGRMSSNGQVFITNASGVVFGRSAQVNVGGLHASTLNISDDDFLNNQNTFTAGSGEAGTVQNQGEITAAPGGYVVLSGAHVNNSGNIYAPGGKVAFAVGDKVSMTVDDNLSVNVTVDETLVNKVQTAQSAIENTGLVSADNGTIELITNVNRAVYTQAINNQGIIEAKGLSADGGTVVLENMGNARVTQGGTINVTSDTGKGGTAHVLGKYVAATNGSLIDASGVTGGGTILIGGDYQGNGTVQNALRTFVDQGATLKANAITTGDGGKVILWSDDTTWFYGNIEAKGGEQSGNGGFVETSGHAYLTYEGVVDTRATKGNIGMLLLDPTDIIVVASGGETSSLTSVDNAFDANIGGDGNTTLNVSAINNALSDVTLQATNDITINAPISITSSGVGLYVDAGRNITVNSSITTNGGVISLGNYLNGSSGDISVLDSISSNGGDIGIYSFGNVTTSSSITSNGGMIQLASDVSGATGTGLTVIGGSINAGSGGIELYGDGIQINNTIITSGSASLYGVLNTQVNIGGSTDFADSGLTLDISSAELGRITAASLGINSLTLSNITTTGTINLPSSIAGLSLNGYDIAVNHTVTSNSQIFLSASNVLQINQAITTNNNTLSLSGQNIDINDTLNAGTGTVDIIGYTETHVGGAIDDGDAAFTLDISSPELLRIVANSVSITSNADSDSVTYGLITAGNITLGLSGAGAYDLNLASRAQVTINHTINTNVHNITLSNDTAVYGEGLGIYGSITSSSGSISLSSGGILNIDGAITQSGTGNITLATTNNNANIGLGASVGGSSSTVNITANGSGTITQSAGTLTGTTINLASTSGTIGTSGSHIQTAAGTLTANTTGNVYITEANAVTLGTSTGSIFNLLTGSNGSITVGGNVTATTLNLTANGSGTISQTTGTITATTLNLASTSGNIGSSGTRLITSAGTLTANTGSTGGVWITNANSLTLGASTAGSGGFDLRSNNNITVGGNLTATAGAINLRADYDGNNSGSIVVNNAISSTTGGINIYAAQFDINSTINSGASGINLAASHSKPYLFANSVDDLDNATNIEVSQAELNRLTAGTTSTFGSGASWTTTAGNFTHSTTGLGTAVKLGGSGVTINHTYTGTMLEFATNQVKINQSINMSNSVTFFNSNPIAIGGAVDDADSAGLMDISQAELNRITASVIYVGNGGSQAISTAGNIALTASGAGRFNMTLNSGSATTTINHSITTTNKNFTATTTNATGIAINNTINAGSGNVTLSTTANNGNIAFSGSVTGTTVTLTAHGSGAISQSSGTLTATTINLTSTSGDIGTSGSRIQTAAGTLTANTGSTGGVWITDADSVILGNSSTGDGGFDLRSTGDITLNQNTTFTKTSSGDATLLLQATNSILMTGVSGQKVTLTGSGGKLHVTLNSDSDASQAGAISLAYTDITTNGGSVAIGGGANPLTTAAYGTSTNNRGIYLLHSTLTTTSGDINLLGRGYQGNLSSSHGVEYSGSTLLTTSGNISLQGYGEGGVSHSNYGIIAGWVAAGARLETTSGNITLLGYGGTGTSNLYGITVSSSQQIRSTSGNIQLTGYAGNGSGANNRGIFCANAANIINGSGSITLYGQGGTGTNGNYGIGYGAFGANGSNIYTTNGGNVSVTGIGGNGSGANNIGIYLDTNSGSGPGGFSIGTTGSSGNITLVGTAGTGTTGLYGISQSSNTSIRSVGSGNISITATGANGYADLYATSGTHNTIIGSNTSTGNITLNINSHNLSSYEFRTQGTITIAPRTNSLSVGLNGGAGDLQIDDSFLNKITTTTVSPSLLVLGNKTTGTGTVTLSNNWDVSARPYNIEIAGGEIVSEGITHASNKTVTLRTLSNGITQSSGVITAGTLNLISTSGDIGTSGSRIQTAAGTLTANTSGNVYVTEADAVTLGASSGSTFDLLTGSNGTIALNGNVTATTLGLTANGNGNITYSSGTLTGTTINLTSTSGDIGTSGSRIQTAAGTLTANTSGNVYITEANAVTLGTSTGSIFDLLTSSNGSITLGGNVTATTLGLTANGSGNIIHSSGTLTGTTLNLTSTSGSLGTSGSRIQTATGTLSANTTGNVYVTEADAITLGASSGNILSIQNSSGNMTLSGLLSGTHISLNSAGALLDGNGASNNLLATGDSSLVAGTYIGTLANPLDVVVSGGTLSVQAGGKLSGVSVDINGTVSPSNALTVVSAPGRVIFNGGLEEATSENTFQTLKFLVKNPELSNALSMNALLTALGFQQQGLQYHFTEPRNQMLHEFHLIYELSKAPLLPNNKLISQVPLSLWVKTGENNLPIDNQTISILLQGGNTVYLSQEITH